MAPSQQQGHLEISLWSETGHILKTNVKSVRFVQVLPTLTQAFQPFAENNSQGTAFYEGKQWNEVENCLSQGKEQKHGRGTPGEQKLHHRHTPALTALVSQQR